MPPPLRSSQQALLEHTGWVRGLAHHLVADPDAADELVQRTWAAALGRPPRHAGNLRAWLATVMRRLLREERRGERRRQERERAAARPEAQEPTDVVERAATHRRLVERLMELDEPFRTTLLLRYFDELPPPEIAARLGVPLDTVRSRLRRGLERLRERLDGAGPRSEWMGAFLAAWGKPPSGPLLVGPAGATTLGALAMDAKLKIGAVCAALACGALFLPPLLGPNAPRDPETPGPADAAATTIVAAQRDAAMPGSAAAAASERRAAQAPPGAPATVEAAPVPRVEGRVLGAEARGVAGVRLVFASRSGARTELESGARGRFELETTEGGVVRAEDPRYATVLAGEVRVGHDVAPIVVVARSIDLAGRVVDELRQPLAGAALELHAPQGFQRRFPHVLDASLEERYRVVSDDGGGFELRGVPYVDGARLVAAKDGHATLERDAPAHGDEDLLVELQRLIAGETNLRGRLTDPGGAPVEGARVSAAGAVVRTDTEGLFSFDPEVRASARVVVAVHPGFLPARQDALETASGPSWPDFVELRLSGPPLSLGGRVVDEAGNALAGARVWIADPAFFGMDDDSPVQLEGLAAGLPSMAELESAGASAGAPNALWSWTHTDERGRFRLEGLTDREYVVAAMDVEGLLRVDSGPVRAGANDLEIELPTQSGYRRLEGRVVSQAGEPVADANLRIGHRSFELSYERSDGESLSTCWDSTGASARTDAEGRFVLERLPLRRASLVVSGDGVEGRCLWPAEVEELEDGAEIRVNTHARACHLRIELDGDPARADRFRLLDAEGGEVPLSIVRGGSKVSSTEGGIEGGASFVYRVLEGVYELVLFLDEEVVARETVTLVPGDVNVLRF